MMQKEESSILEETYIQKSRLFLFPLTGVIKHRDYKVVNTYISAKNLKSAEYDKGISVHDEVLITVFPSTYVDTEGWADFESAVLLSNNQFLCFHDCGDDLVYTFDLSKWSRDWSQFVRGRYSLFSEAAKTRIIDYRWSSLTPIEQKKLFFYLHPYKEEAIEMFSKQLGVAPEELLQIKELCSKPNLSIEEYKLSEKIKTEVVDEVKSKKD